jgi:hypothetical protein
MGIKITQALQKKLDDAFGAGAAKVFCDEFAQWRKSGTNILFGRDEPYRREPKVDGDDKLLHVHLMPDIEVNPGAHDLWVKRWRRKRPASWRTSDNALVYVSDDAGNFLLIFILDEPGAHEIAQMKTPQNRATMEGFAAVAEAFRHDGSVIV